jgi:hypothetical protein
MIPSVIATLATGGAIEDLRTLLASLTIFNPNPPTVYLYCDDRVQKGVKKFNYPGTLLLSKELQRYTGLTRSQMENMPSPLYSSLWFEFMAEKIRLMEWAFQQEELKRAGKGEGISSDGILFCDADICFLAPLPSIPDGTVVALSPHEIRATDEAKYGRYNGGFFWMANPTPLKIWRDACLAGSRFFEQSALEDVAAAMSRGGELYEFPRTQNYGWWRLFQGEQPPTELQKEWTMNRRKVAGSSGILINGQALGSIHTHFTEKADQITAYFNQWVLNWLGLLAKGGHSPAKQLLSHFSRRS